MGVLIALDQLTKKMALTTLSLYQSVAVIPGLLHADLVFNYGAAYGILQHQTLFLLAVSSTVILGGLIGARYIVQSAWSKSGLCLVLAGAVGNTIDRAVYGYVVDFINCFWIPVFNLADTFIFCGVVCFIYEMSRDIKKVR